MANMDLELIVDIGFDPLKDQPVSALDLAVGFEVIDLSPIHSDSLGIAEIQEFATCELNVIVRNDAIGDPKPMDDVLNELSARSDLRLMMGRTLIHIVNLSMVTRRWSKLSGPFLNSPNMSRHQTTNGQVMGIV